MAREPVDDADLEEEVLPNPDDPDDVDADLLPEDEDPDAIDESLETADADLDVDPPPAKKPLTKYQRDVINLRKRAQEAEDRAARAEELAQRTSGQVDILTRQGSQGNSAERERAEQERLANMSDREYADYMANKVHQQTQGAMAQQSFQLQDRLDRSDFRDICRGNSAYASVQAEVEKRLVDLRRNNVNVDRQVLADKILGERAAARAANGGNKNRRVVTEQPRRQASKSAASGPDQIEDRPQRGGRKNESAGDRLSRLNVKF